MFIISKKINHEQVVHYFSPLLKERGRGEVKAAEKSIFPKKTTL